MAQGNVKSFKRTRTSKKGKKIVETVTAHKRGLHPNTVKHHFKKKAVPTVDAHRQLDPEGFESVAAHQRRLLANAKTKTPSFTSEAAQTKEKSNPNWRQKLNHKKGSIAPPTSNSFGSSAQRSGKVKSKAGKRKVPKFVKDTADAARKTSYEKEKTTTVTKPKTSFGTKLRRAEKFFDTISGKARKERKVRKKDSKIYKIIQNITSARKTKR